jgi:DNA-binding IclR family transcriptional regulator
MMGTTAKALSMLDYFTRQRHLIGLSELARLSGVNKATCFRLVSELVDSGLLEQETASRSYRIGPAVLHLAALREATVPTREAALAVLRQLAQSVGETAHLSHLVAGRLMTLGFAYAPVHGIRVSMEDADQLPFHATASGKAVLAHLPDDQRDAILAGALPALTPSTTTDPALLRAELSAILQTGLSEARGSFESEVHSIAVPLFAADGHCRGALAVAMPAARFSEVRPAVAKALIAAGTEVTALWGGSPLPAHRSQSAVV